MHRIVTLLAGIVAVFVAVLPPLVYFASRHEAQRAILRTEAQLYAAAVTQLVNLNPQLWQFEYVRLEELLSRGPIAPVTEARVLSGLDGKVVAQVGGALGGLLLTERAPVHDSGRVVGTLSVARPLKPLLLETALVGLLALLLAGAAFYVLRTLPLRALRNALDDARREHERASESEARSRLLWQTSTDTVVLLDAESRMRYVNPAVRTMFGWEPEEVTGQELAMLQPAALAAAHREGLRRYLQSGVKKLDWSGVETTARRKDGSEFPVEIVFAEIHSAGEPLFAGFIRDITVRKRAEAAIRESEERLFKVFHVSPVAISVATVDQGVYIEVNDSYSELFGYSREEMIGQSALALGIWVDPGLRASIVELLDREGVVRNMYGRVRCKSGEQRDVQFSMAVTSLAGAEKPVLVCTFEDVTERLRIRRLLEDNERRYRLLFDANPHPMLVYDHQTLMIRAVNDAAVHKYGYSRAEFLTMPIHRLRGENQESAFLAQRPGDPNAPFRVTGRHYTSSGVPFDIELLSHGLEFDGRASRLVLINDISDSLRAKAQIEQLNFTLEQKVLDRTAQLEAVNQELEAFCYSVSHDLRAPVRHIGAFTQILISESGAMSGESRDYLDRISQSARRMGLLIDDLLNLSRTSRMEMQVQAIDTMQVVREAREECLRDMPARDIEWRIAELPPVLADAGLLRLVLVNLFANAVKFTSKVEQPVIEVSARPSDPGTVILCVRDNGAGFDMRYVGKLFGVFERLHTDAEFEGTGIGLATVRRVVERLGGRVWADGELGKGAAFFVELKAA